MRKAYLIMFVAVCFLGATIGYAARPPGSPAPVKGLTADAAIEGGATLSVVEREGVFADITRMKGKATVRERFTLYGQKITRVLAYRDGRIQSTKDITVNGKKPQITSLLFTDGRSVDLAARAPAGKLRVVRPVSFPLIAGGAIVFFVLLVAGSRLLTGRRRSGM